MAVLYRSICRDFFTDADVVELSHTARLLYLATWLEADREGRLPWNLRTLSIRYFPRDNVDLDGAAQELFDTGLIVPYFAEERSLAWLPTFGRFQTFNNREAASKLPPPVRVPTRDDASRRVLTGEHAHDVMECNVMKDASRRVAPGLPSQAMDSLHSECVHSGNPSGINSGNGGSDDF